MRSNRRLTRYQTAKSKPLINVLLCFVATSVPLLIQQNDGLSYFFNRSWEEFKVGFGNTSGNYWLGNDQLSQLTLSRVYKLRIDLQLRNTSNWHYAEYSWFRVLTEADNYMMTVYGYSGNAGSDALGHYHHNGQMFSTYDRDNDMWSSGNCAVWTGGGFWYHSCGYAFINLPQVGGSATFSWYLPAGIALQTSRMWLQGK